MNMIRIFRNALLGAGLLLLLTRMPAAAQQAARVALVIGNAGYTDAPDLPQAKNDAQAVAQTLKQLGFQVISVFDADKRGMDDAVKRFGAQIENGGVALFYYSGHGLQAENGLNYLVPLASGITKAADIPYQAVSANWILASMEEWNERGVNLMILDACRNPLKVKGGAEGLAPMEVAGSLVAYATAANQRARIEPGATFSVYTKHLLNVLQTNPCQKIRDLFAEVADSVALSGSGQQPYIVQSPLVGRFQFAECAVPTPEPAQPTPRPSQEGNTHPSPSEEGNTTELPSSEGPGVGSCWENATPGAECREEATGMEFVYVPGGCFQMGQTEMEKAQLIKDVGEKNYTIWYADELPRHQVCVKGFWMGKYEVTNAQYRRFKADHDSQYYEGKSLNGDEQPVVMVSWNDAQAFVKQLNASVETHGRASLQFRLPTEAEWEYAARGGTETIRSWGDDPKHTQACQYANVGDSVFAAAFPNLAEQLKKDYRWFAHSCDDGYAVTAPVGSFRPNDFGLYDMLGNVWEWCLDAYASYSDTPTDGSAYGSLGDEKANRLLRGGSWLNVPNLVRSASRNWVEPENQNYNVGFRLVFSRTQ